MVIDVVLQLTNSFDTRMGDYWACLFEGSHRYLSPGWFRWAVSAGSCGSLLVSLMWVELG